MRAVARVVTVGVAGFSPREVATAGGVVIYEWPRQYRGLAARW
jgi:hypothetical protein